MPSRTHLLYNITTVALSDRRTLYGIAGQSRSDSTTIVVVGRVSELEQDHRAIRSLRSTILLVLSKSRWNHEVGSRQVTGDDIPEGVSNSRTNRTWDFHHNLSSGQSTTQLERQYDPSIVSVTAPHLRRTSCNDEVCYSPPLATICKRSKFTSNATTTVLMTGHHGTRIRLARLVV